MPIRTVKGRPITASRVAKARKPVLTTSNTSSDLQKMLRQAPAPFANQQYAPTSLPSHPAYRVGSNFAKQGLQYGGVPRSVGVRNTNRTNYAASGDRKPGGYNSIISGFPLTGNKRVVGRISTNKGPTAAINRAFAKDYKRKDIKGLLGR